MSFLGFVSHFLTLMWLQLVGASRMKKLLSSNLLGAVWCHHILARRGVAKSPALHEFVLMLEFWQDEDEPEEQVPDKAQGLRSR